MGALEFNQLLVSNAEFLKPFAITLTRDSEEAKDLFQETLYRAIANKDKYNVGTNIKAWLYTIMRNIFINNYRRRAKHFRGQNHPSRPGRESQSGAQRRACSVR